MPTLRWSMAGWGFWVSTLMGCRACGERGPTEIHPWAGRLEEGPTEGREGSRGEDCMHGQSPVSLGGWQDMD